MSTTETTPVPLQGWGRTAPTRARVLRPRDDTDVARALQQAGPRGVVARGLGRSYGDAAQNAGGLALDLTGLDRVLTLDAATEPPTATVEAGVSLDALMRAALPLGLWVPVLPGTRQVTVGGAIGADVHGKNHHSKGSFGDHVTSLDLVLPSGELRTLTPDGEGSTLFWATVGGMGLTGVVVRATLALQRVETAYFSVDTDRAGDLDDLLARMSSGDEDYEYSVAWFDAVTRGRHLGRAVLTRGEKAGLSELSPKQRRDPLAFTAPSFGTVPDVFPPGLVNRLTGKAFSEMWFRKAPAHRVGEVQNLTQFFHPLDIVAQWNRLYGAPGFLQYQFVVPFDAEEAFRRAVVRIVASGHVSCLNVLKRFGPGNRGLLSFPEPGWTLTVDLPVRDGLDRLCRDLDELVLGAGGRNYLAKDSRLDADSFARMYPRLAEFRAVRDEVDPERVLTSDLARRLHL